VKAAGIREKEEEKNRVGKCGLIRLGKRFKLEHGYFMMEERFRMGQKRFRNSAIKRGGKLSTELEQII